MDVSSIWTNCQCNIVIGTHCPTRQIVDMDRLLMWTDHQKGQIVNGRIVLLDRLSIWTDRQYGQIVDMDRLSMWTDRQYGQIVNMDRSLMAVLSIWTDRRWPYHRYGQIVNRILSFGRPSFTSLVHSFAL